MRAVPRLCKLYPGICLTTEEKARKLREKNENWGKSTETEEKGTETEEVVRKLRKKHTQVAPMLDVQQLQIWYAAI